MRASTRLIQSAEGDAKRDAELTHFEYGILYALAESPERTPASWWLNNVFYAGGGNLRFRLFEQQAD